METGKDGSTITHGVLSPNLSWQRIFAKGCRPRQLFTRDQGGKGSAQSAPVLMGRGDTPAEQRRNILLATANARAVQALRTADQVNVTSEDSNEVALAVEAATAAVDYAADVQEMTESGTSPAQAGKGSGTRRMSMVREHYAAKGASKGKGTGKALEMDPYDGDETAEEEASESDMEVILEEDEGNGDEDGDGGGADGPAEAPLAPPMFSAASSAADPPGATTTTEVAITSTMAGDPVNVEEEVTTAPENVLKKRSMWSRTQRLEMSALQGWCGMTLSMRWRRWSQEVWGNRCGQIQVWGWHQQLQRSTCNRSTWR